MRGFTVSSLVVTVRVKYKLHGRQHNLGIMVLNQRFSQYLAIPHEAAKVTCKMTDSPKYDIRILAPEMKLSFGKFLLKTRLSISEDPLIWLWGMLSTAAHGVSGRVALTAFVR